MLKSLKLAAGTAVLALFATPVAAQDEPEEARTTYAVTMIKLADGAEERWDEMRNTYMVPARERAGLAATQVHWVMMNPDYDLILVDEMPRGMSSFDTHANPERAAMLAAMAEIAGGEEALEAIGDEYDELVENETTFYTHVHP